MSGPMEEAWAEMEGEIAALKEEVGELREEAQAAEERVEYMANEMVYRGNSVSYWWSKTMAYSGCIDKVCAALNSAGMVFDGKKSAVDLIQELAADRDKLRIDNYGLEQALYKEQLYGTPVSEHSLRERIHELEVALAQERETWK